MSILIIVAIVWLAPVFLMLLSGTVATAARAIVVLVRRAGLSGPRRPAVDPVSA